MNLLIWYKDEIRYYDIVVISTTKGGLVALPSGQSFRCGLRSLRSLRDKGTHLQGWMQAPQLYVWLRVRYYNKEVDIYSNVTLKVMKETETRKWSYDIVIISMY